MSRVEIRKSASSTSPTSSAGGTKVGEVISQRTITQTTKTSEAGGTGADGNNVSESYYRASMAPRTTLISRTGPGQMSSSRTSKTTEVRHSPSITSLGYSSANVSAMKGEREKEKKDMQDLNERFASYIEKIRFLEAQNRKLAQELETLKSRWGKETQEVKKRYEVELTEARNLIDDLTKEKSKWELRCHTMEDELSSIKQRYDDLLRRSEVDRETIQKQHQQMSDYESEINLLRRRIAFLEDEHKKDKATIKKLNDDVMRLRTDLDNETLMRIDAENKLQTLEEELEFLKNIHEQELKEMAALAYKDPIVENREFWKSEMAMAIRDIQTEYDERLGSVKTELENHFTMKLNEVRTGGAKSGIESAHYKEETKKLRNQLAELRAKVSDLEAKCNNLQREYEMLLREYQDKESDWDQERTELTMQLNEKVQELESMSVTLNDLLDAKLSLELEIIAYRKLLEGHEGSLSQTIENWYTWVQTHGTNTHLNWLEEFGGDVGGGYAGSTATQKGTPVGEMAQKTTYQRSAKGNISITEAQSDGKVVILENTGPRPENLIGWKIKRVIDGRKEHKWEFPQFTLHNASTVKVYAKGNMTRGERDAFETNDDSWGIGTNVTTFIYNDRNEERATHIQKSIYSA